MALIEKLKAIADAIRGKTGKTEEMTLDQMVTEIEGIATGGGGDSERENAVISRTITEYTNDSLTIIGSRAFCECMNLAKIDCPNVTKTVGNGYCFENCPSLVDVNLPLLQTGTSYFFQKCTALERISLPAMVTCGYGAFRYCTALKQVDYGPNMSKVDFNLFNGCTALGSVVLRSASVVTLSNVNAFASTPFAIGGTGGTGYVPQALISQYQQATNWSTLYAAGTCNFVAIEGSEYE